MQDILAGLNNEQVRATKVIKGPVLVLAGAGSGKTKALTHRIAYLHQEHKVPLSNILAITFTNKAAGEMSERVQRLLGLRSTRPTFISTFHSFCARLLRIEAKHFGYSQKFTILDGDDQLTAVKRAMEELSIDTKHIHPEAVRSHISSAKNELVDVAGYRGIAQGSFQQTVARVYEAYQNILRKNQSLDFDDLIMKTVELFRQEPKILEKYQKQFEYILVDEYQDTNTAQYELVKLLAKKHQNLFVVGDDWQSIYSWRGANYQNILNFHRDYPKAMVIKLEQNYRSSQNILDAAHSVIVHNRNRSEKKLWTEQAAGELVTIFEANTEKAEGEFIVMEAERLRAKHRIQLNDMVVLYRTNAQSRSIEESLLRAGLPYRVIGGVRFYERKEIKDILAYLGVLANPNNTLALARIINVPVRGIGKKTWEDFMAKVAETGISAGELLLQDSNLQPVLQTFGKLLKRLVSKSQTVSLSKLLDVILVETGYKKMLADTGIEGQTRIENIYELKSVMEKYDHLKTAEALEIFLEEVTLIADIDNYQPTEDAITLMTLHSAKGLEFDYVFIAGMEENLFPHSRSLFDSQELEEERRLCYVGITRARKKVYLIHARERLIYGSLQLNQPSRFISDLPPELLETISAHTHQPTVVKIHYSDSLKPGAKVDHSQFGQGVVISRTADIVTVAFVKSGIKTLAAELAKLKLRK
ncbi:MAG: UvrD-helicase domain-containing protein [Patescibacteria group bacterium]